MNTATDSNYPLPDQRPPGKDFPDIAPRALGAWLDGLPMGDAEVAAARILDLLHRVNRTRLTDADRVNLVRQVSARSWGPLLSLHQQLRDLATPPTPREMGLAELLILLHDELALAYRGIIDCNPRRKRLLKPTSQGLAEPLVSATDHLYQFLKVHLLTKIPPPDGLWKRLYALLAFARDSGLHDRPMQYRPGGEAGTVERLFKCAVLAHLSSPEALRGAEVVKLFELLADLAPHAGLLIGGEQSGQSVTALMSIRNGSPPTLDFTANCHDCPHNGDCLRLDLGPFLRQVRQKLNGIAGEPANGDLARASEQRVLEHLGTRFGGRRKRRTKRIVDHQNLELVAGLRDACAWLSGCRTPEAAKEARRGVRQAPAEQSGKVHYDVLLNVEQVSLNSPARQTAPPDFIPQVSAAPPLPVRRVECSTLNFSAGGYCLSASEGSANFRIRVGELLILREQNADRWLPGVVTWLSSDGREVQFGAKLLAPHMQPARALCHGEGNAESTECLLLFERDNVQPASVIMGPRCLPANTEISVSMGNHSLGMVLTKELSRTPGYVEYACGETTWTKPLREDSRQSPPQTRDAGNPEFDTGTPGRDQRPWRRYLS
jgi:hypothetical protein